MTTRIVMALLLIASSIAPSRLVTADELPTVLVFPVELIDSSPDDEGMFPATLSGVLTDEIQMALMEQGGVKPVTVANLSTQLKKASVMEVMDCEGDECLKKVTDNFGVEHNLYAKVTPMGDKLHVTLTWTFEDEVVKVQTAFSPNDSDALIAIARKAAVTLFAELAPSGVGTGPVATVPRKTGSPTTDSSSQATDGSTGTAPGGATSGGGTLLAAALPPGEKVNPPIMATTERTDYFWIMAPQFSGMVNLAHEQLIPGTELAMGFELSHHLITTSVTWGLTQKNGVSSALLGVGVGYSYDLPLTSFMRLELGGILGYYEFDVDIADDPEASTEYDAALFVLLRPTIHIELGNDMVFASLGARVGIGSAFVPGFTVGLGFRL